MTDRSYRIAVDSSTGRLNSVGPLIPGSWTRTHDDLNREIRGEFLIDTGAYGAMIDLEIAEALGLEHQGSREIHGIHGFGRLQQYLGRVLLPAVDAEGCRTVYSTVIDCVGVPSLREKNREHGADVIGILGRIFLGNSRLVVDGATGRIELEIPELQSSDRH
jgi:predicted aspartyl protease